MQETEQKIGIVKKFFAKPSVAAIELTEGSLDVGDTIHIKGHTTDFESRIDRIEIEHQAVEKAAVGMLIGVKVTERVRENDVVYRKLPT